MKKIAIILLSLCASAFAQEKVFAFPVQSDDLDEVTKKVLANKVRSTIIEQGKRGIYSLAEQYDDADLILHIIVVEVFNTMLVYAHLEKKSSTVEAAVYVVSPLKTMPDLESISHKIASNLLERRKKFVSSKPEINVSQILGSNIGKALTAIICEQLANSGDFNLASAQSSQYAVDGKITSVFGSNMLSFNIKDNGNILKKGEADLNIDSARISNLEKAASKVTEFAKQASLPIDIFTDSRDNKTYRILNTGDGTWFLDNLEYGNSSRYSWSKAINSCPSGWHLPNDGDWTKLAVRMKNNPTFREEYLRGDKGWWSAKEATLFKYYQGGRDFIFGGYKTEKVRVAAAEIWYCSYDCDDYYNSRPVATKEQSDNWYVRCVK
jgi:uncharacterized protein (TIGR02145 family)